MRKGVVLLAAVPLLLLGARDVSAQFRIGPQVAWGEDADLAVGARMTANLNTNVIAGTGPLHGFLSFDYFLDCSSCSWFEITPAVYIPFTIRSVGPFAGAGLNIRRVSFDGSPGLTVDTSDTDLGLALFGGLQFPLAGKMAMADARITLGGSEQLVISLAWLFGGGGGDQPAN